MLHLPNTLLILSLKILKKAIIPSNFSRGLYYLILFADSAVVSGGVGIKYLINAHLDEAFLELSPGLVVYRSLTKQELGHLLCTVGTNCLKILSTDLGFLFVEGKPPTGMYVILGILERLIASLSVLRSQSRSSG